MNQIFLILLFFSCFCISQVKNDSIKQPKIGLVLSGGGAKGYAHIGAIKALEEYGIKPDYIGGTSMGAIVGSLYAVGYTPQQLEQIVQELDFDELLINDKKREDIPYFDKRYKEKYILEVPFDDFEVQVPGAISKGQGPANVYSYLLRHVHNINDFNELPIPFLCIGTELSTGKEKVFRSGYLPKVVLASGAYPSLLNPVEIDSVLYTDGGVVNNYPAKEVKEMGADILIGIDLGQDLLKDDKLKSATKILEQIIRYRIVDKTAEQRKYVDINIHPDLEEYSVVDFEQKDSIMLIGYNATKEAISKLQNLNHLQKNRNRTINVNLDNNIIINKLIIYGAKDFSRSFIKGKLNLELGKEYSYEKLSEGIDALYASGHYENVFYKIESENGEHTLVLDVVEDPNRLTAKIGLRYDDLYETSLLLNLTATHFIFNNSALSANLILGDYLRYALNFYIDNGFYPSFGFNAFHNEFEAPLSVEDTNLREVEYEWDEFTNQFYVQSTLAERYAIGIGIENQIIQIESDDIQDSNPLQEFDEGTFYNLYGFIGADNRNHSNFPTKGLNIYGEYKILTTSNADMSTNSYFKGQLELNIPITSYFTLQNHFDFGTFFGDDVSPSQRFISGGFNEQKFLNSSRFYGLPFGYTSGIHQLILGMGGQFKFLKNHYFTPTINFGNWEDSFNLLQYFSYDFTTYGLKYGYDSPLGPLNFYWFYSPQTNQGRLNVALGFWF